MPPAQHNLIAGMTLISLCGLTPDSAWSSAERRRCSVTKGIMDYLAEHYGTNYAANTRETFRRQVLHQFVQGRIADYNPFEPDLPTNSPKAHYAVTELALDVVRRYGTEGWASAVDRFRCEHGALAERYARDRNRSLTVRLPDGRELQLSPGRHNEVQRAIVEEFGLPLQAAPDGRERFRQAGTYKGRLSKNSDPAFTLATQPRKICWLTGIVSQDSVSGSPTTTSCPT